MVDSQANNQTDSQKQAPAALVGSVQQTEPDWFAEYLGDLLPAVAVTQGPLPQAPVEDLPPQIQPPRLRPPVRQPPLVSAGWADQVPTDQPLAPSQKEQLQRLFDHALTQVRPVQLDHLSAEEPPASLAKTPSSSDLEIPATLQVDSVMGASQASIVAPLAQPEPLSAVAVTVVEAEVSVAQSIEPANDQTPKPILYREHWSGADAQGRPSWAQARFDVLLFHTRGVTLGIPLISLGHIYWQREALSTWPGAQPWFMGVKPLGQEALQVVDAGQYFLPDRPVKAPDPDGDDELPAAPDFTVLQLAGSLWSLAVEGVANPVVVTDSDIQWRSFHAGSPWLAGAIKKHLCVLLDPPALIKALNRAGKDSRVTS